MSKELMDNKAFEYVVMRRITADADLDFKSKAEAEIKAWIRDPTDDGIRAAADALKQLLESACASLERGVPPDLITLAPTVGTAREG